MNYVSPPIEQYLKFKNRCSLLWIFPGYLWEVDTWYAMDLDIVHGELSWEGGRGHILIDPSLGQQRVNLNINNSYSNPYLQEGNLL